MKWKYASPLGKRLSAYTRWIWKTTVKVQAVATLDLKFIDESVGWPGSVHNSTIYQNNSLLHALRTKFSFPSSSCCQNILILLRDEIQLVFI